MIEKIIYLQNFIYLFTYQQFNY